MSIYVIWFVGDGSEPPGLCYRGREVFTTTLLSQAKSYVEMLENEEDSLKGLFVIKKLMDVKEE